ADASQAYRAIQVLLANRQQGLALLKERLGPVAAADAKKITRLVVDLDNEEFAVREQATRQLREIGDLAEPALRAILADKPSPELRGRAEGLLAQVDASRSPTQMRAVRAVEVLEYVGGPEARHVLQKLADGALQARLTREAKAALARMAKRD